MKQIFNRYTATVSSRMIIRVNSKWFCVTTVFHFVNRLEVKFSRSPILKFTQISFVSSLFNFRIYVRKFFTSKKMFLCASIYNACNAMYTSGSHSTLCRLQTGRRRSGASTAIAWQLITNCNVTPAVNSDMLGTYYITANNIMSRSWELWKYNEINILISTNTVHNLWAGANACDPECEGCDTLHCLTNHR